MKPPTILHSTRRLGLLVPCAASLVCADVRAQGTVNFGNNNSTAITNTLTMMRVIAGTTFHVGLYYMPDQPVAPTTLDMDLRGFQIGAFGIIQPGPGLFAAGTRTTPATTPGGAFAWFQVRAWDSAFGSTYETAADNDSVIQGRVVRVGTSNIIRVKTGDPLNNITPGALTAYGLQPFVVEFIPEPGALALAALGLGMVLVLRRRGRAGLSS
jgi:hypothetical protein